MGIYIYGLRAPSKARDIEIAGRVYRAAVSSFQANVGMGCNRALPRGLEARWARTEKAWDGEAKPEFVIETNDGKVEVGNPVFRMERFQVSWYDTPDFGGMEQVGEVRDIPRGGPVAVAWTQFEVVSKLQGFKLDAERNYTVPEGNEFEGRDKLYALNSLDAAAAWADDRERVLSPRRVEGTALNVFPLGGGPNYKLILDLEDRDESD